MNLAQTVDKLVLVEVGVEVAEVRGDAEIAGGDDGARGGVAPGVDVELEVVFEEAPEGLEDAALEVRSSISPRRCP